MGRPSLPPLETRTVEHCSPPLPHSGPVSTALPPSPVNFRQQLSEQGIGPLGISVQGPDPLAGRPRQASRGGPVQRFASPGNGDAGERAVIHQEFAAKFAAARLCTPRASLDAVLQALSRDQRARLDAVQAKAVIRRDVRSAERLADRYRRAARVVAMGVPTTPQRPTAEMVQDRIKASILRNRPG